MASADALDVASGGLDAQYQDHLANAMKAGAQPLPYAAFQRQQDLTAMAADIYNAYDQQYLNATGQHIPAAQRSLVINALSKASPDMINKLIPAWKATRGDVPNLSGGNYIDYQKYLGLINLKKPTQAQRDDLDKLMKSSIGSALKSFGGMLGFLDQQMYDATGGAVGSTTKSASSASAAQLSPQQYWQQQRDYTNANTFANKFGHPPTDAQLKAMRGLNEDDLNNYFNNQQYKLGLTYGQWQVAAGNINGQYMKYFGRNATDQEVAWANGKSTDDINAHIMDSPSRVDGLKMGDYIAYKNALDNESTKMFGYAAPDEMINAFHKAQNQ